MLCPLPCCDVVSWRDDTKTIKPIINEALVVSSRDIITDYNDLYCLFTCHVASRCVNITILPHLGGFMQIFPHRNADMLVCVSMSRFGSVAES